MRLASFGKWASSLLLLSLPLAATAWNGYGGDVDISVVSDRGRSYPLYPVHDRDRDSFRAYLEASPHERYRIRVRNRTGQRIGLVIAVDGRNIISGRKSHLKPDERMYVLGPYEQATYSGWRTGSNRVNEFYFTRSDDSYAGAFGDYTAMGVIAVAVYHERAHRRRYSDDYRYEDERRASPGRESGSGSKSEAQRAPMEKHDDWSQPGTGFGDERYSPSIRVEFEPERRAASRYFIKYEWRETLCELGIVDCRHRNRFWPDDRWDDSYGYAPYPPGHDSRWRWRW